jgi:hypothetical protein
MGPVHYSGIGSLSPDDTYSCAIRNVNRLGFTVVDADRGAGFIRAEKDVAGAGTELLTGENYWVLLTVAVYESQDPSATEVKVTVARAKEGISGETQGQRTTGGMATKSEDREAAQEIVNRCAGATNQVAAATRDTPAPPVATEHQPVQESPDPAAVAPEPTEVRLRDIPPAESAIAAEPEDPLEPALGGRSSPTPSPKPDDSGLIRGAWKPLNPDREQVTATDESELEYWSGEVVADDGTDLPRVTVRLYEKREIGSHMGSTVYWSDSGTCVYSLELRDISGDTMMIEQVAQDRACSERGRISFTTLGEVMLGQWYHPDGTTWFSARLAR